MEYFHIIILILMFSNFFLSPLSFRQINHYKILKDFKSHLIFPFISVKSLMVKIYYSMKFLEEFLIFNPKFGFYFIKILDLEFKFPN